jgi:hypothetical protein
VNAALATVNYLVNTNYTGAAKKVKLTARRKLPTVDVGYVLVIGYFRVCGRDDFGLEGATSV